MQTITVNVRGGVVQDVTGVPPGVAVEVRDYDTEDVESVVWKGGPAPDTAKFVLVGELVRARGALRTVFDLLGDAIEQNTDTELLAAHETVRMVLSMLNAGDE
jgi:hypothetical protein